MFDELIASMEQQSAAVRQQAATALAEHNASIGFVNATEHWLSEIRRTLEDDNSIGGGGEGETLSAPDQSEGGDDA